MNNQTKTFQEKLREQDEQIRKENELQNKMIKWTVFLGVAPYVYAFAQFLMMGDVMSHFPD
ncbi:hypothetical protein, partial [Kingella kingae]|uniref:hypothetical protein n=1 Tax=Kingella kingae TaxID=504 RepID=UPI0018AD3E94